MQARQVSEMFDIVMLVSHATTFLFQRLGCIALKATFVPVIKNVEEVSNSSEEQSLLTVSSMFMIMARGAL